MPDLSTREILENQFNGLTPIKRQNPRYGEKDYYYINPNRDKYSSLSDEDIAYVDSPDDPNPFLQQSSTSNPLSPSSSNEMGIDTYNHSSPFSTSSIMSTNTNDGMTTNNTTLSQEPSWYKGFGLSKTNSGLGIPNNNALWNQQINPTTMSRRQNVTGTTLTQRPNNKTSFMDSFSSSLKHDLDDTMYGAKRALSGMTLGGSDWLLRQAGITDDDYLSEREAEGLEIPTRSAGLIVDFGGNIISGKALLKGMNILGKKISGMSNIDTGWESTPKFISSSLMHNTPTFPMQQNINVEYGDIIPNFKYIIAPNSSKSTDWFNLYDETMHRINQAKSEANKMAQHGKQLVQTYGSGAGNDIDNYYHAKLQCNFAKESPYVRNLGLAMGVGKEFWDLKKKLFDKNNYPLPTYEYIKDSVKDLKNNLYGSKTGYYNQDIPCKELLDHMRTDYMRQADIW